MSVPFRHFTAPDLFGAPIEVEFRWIQNGISIRHADTVDVKFEIVMEGRRQERVLALPHPQLLRVSAESGHPITDPWCSRMAALHLKHMIESGDDFEKTLVTLTGDQMNEYAKKLKPELAEAY
ncbi:MAG: hypothetical protein NTV52_07240 [Acidobacteria bacterium]|nr:hypothetical protein [Acidobacteriota bacterium]